MTTHKYVDVVLSGIVLALVVAVIVTPKLSPSISAQQTAPVFTDPDLQITDIGSGFSYPVDIAFTPDGSAFVIELAGKVKFIRPDGTVQTAPVIDLRAVIGAQFHWAVTEPTGVVLDPLYNQNKFIYFVYTAVTHANPVVIGQVVRYTINDSNPSAIAVDSASQRFIFGQSLTDGHSYASCQGNHNIDSAVFGADGTMLISIGDGAGADMVDAGADDATCSIPSECQIGAFRSQNINCVAGKIYRVDPSTGLGLPSNPFYDGDPTHNRSKVWGYGLRNPFRFTVVPGTGSANPSNGNPGILVVGDVGWNDWEEVNVARGGENFGWPCWEGGTRQDLYQAATPSNYGCNTLPATPGLKGTAINPGLLTLPQLAYPHTVNRETMYPAGITPFEGISVTGGTFYMGTEYPQSFWGRYIFGDFQGDPIPTWLKKIEFDSNLVLSSVSDVANGGLDSIVAIRPHPQNGDLVLVSFGTNRIMRISRGSSSPPPPPPPYVPDVFQCHYATGGTNLNRTLTVSDARSATQQIVVQAPNRVCPPASLNESPAPAGHPSLVAYTTQASFLSKNTVTVTNQYGSAVWTVGSPKEFWTPSSVSLQNPAPPVPSGSDNIRCYEASGPQADAPVTVTEMFETTGVRILSPQMLCYPAQVGSQPVSHPQVYQACYRVRRPQTYSFSDVTAFIQNMFGSFGLTVGRSQFLCLPSTVS